MRQRTKRMTELLKEYNELKNRIFGNFSFVIWEDKDIDFERYNQLMMFFHPQFRTSDFVNPLEVKNVSR